MRSDSVGLFWQDIKRSRGDRAGRVMPPIPDTGWEAPTEFPNLAAAKALSIDVETYDPELKIHGPGWARGVGHIVGIAVGVPEGGRWYFPMRHTIESDTNMDPDHVLAWAKDNLTGLQPKIGANLTYDIGWLRQEGIRVRGPLHDTEFAEALLSEEPKVNLDALGKKHLGIGKETNILYDWCATYYGGREESKDQRKNIYRAPPRLVGPYAEGDVDLPLRILERQWPLLHSEGLLDVYSMECRLIYLIVEMRFAGVSIDVNKAEELRDRLVIEVAEIDKEFVRNLGFPINTNSSDSLARAFDACGLRYGRTDPTKNFPNGKPSFTKLFLKTVDHPIADLIRKKRAHEKLIGTFLEGYLLNAHVNGKVYGSFNQLRSDEEGARSGRFSSSNPNLQNIPIRVDLGKQIRACFIPDEGHKQWRKNDYSQIEYRGLAHFAVGPGADNVRRKYQNDPKTDFHMLVQGIIKQIVNLDLDRSLVKNVNFGTVYGMGEPGLARYINVPLKKARELLNAIKQAAPFLRSTMDATMQEARMLGYITTILGRRSRFELWVPGKFDEDAIPLPFERAMVMYQNPQRAYIHKALNRRLQGSAADLIKMAMLQCWESGVFDETGVPRLQVHDELDFSDPGEKEEAFAETRRIMETAIPFRVPVIVGNEIGPSWGQVEANDA